MTKDQALVLTIILYLKKIKREKRKTDPMGGFGSTSKSAQSIQL
jgi:hypothetical protein